MSDLPTVYIETTIPSLLAARPSNDPIVAGQQAATLQWWDIRRPAFRLFVSEAVIEEVLKGDRDAAARRLSIISGISELEIDAETVMLTDKILQSKVIPAKAGADAAHVAISARHGIDYLMTWNCRHIANAEIIRALGSIVAKQGFVLPIICTPHELLGGFYDN